MSSRANTVGNADFNSKLVEIQIDDIDDEIIKEQNKGNGAISHFVTNKKK